MKVIKIKKLKTSLLSNDEIDIIHHVKKLCNKGKLKKAKHKLEEFDLEELLNKFSNKKDLDDYEVDILRDIIVIFKSFYSNGKTLIDDEIYDKALVKLKKYTDEPIVENLVIRSKRVHNTQHEFPELKGTLDKCNLKTEDECINSNDTSLESYITKWFNCMTEEYLELKFTKKFDGNSDVGTIDENGDIELMVTRGEDGVGSDITNLFKKRKFVSDKKRRGVQFEIVMTKENYKKYCEKSGNTYANLRTAVTSILTSLEGEKYSKYLSLVPIKMSDQENEYMSKNTYINNKLNDLYATDVSNYEIRSHSDDLKQILRLTYKIVDDYANYRDKLDFAIDGVVIECTNPSVREKYPRKNNINQYMVAYKFPPEERLTKVTGIEACIGRTGLVTPNLYYEHIDFNGGDYDHSSIGSAKRVETLQLKIGETIRLTYNGDVMPYVHKYECEENKNLKGKLIELPKKCKCGCEFVQKGAHLYCMNDDCSEKLYPKLAYFYTSLGINDVKEKFVEAMIKNNIIHGFKDCLHPKYSEMYSIDGFGEKKIKAFKKQMDELRNTKIPEAKLMKALSITGETISAKILSEVSLIDILEDKNKLYEKDIYQVGEKTKDKFINNLFKLKDIVINMMDELNIVQNFTNDNLIKLAFTGLRPDEKLKASLLMAGYECLDNFNKSVSYVIASDKNSNSGTAKKARKNNIPILTLEEFLENIKEEINDLKE